MSYKQIKEVERLSIFLTVKLKKTNFEYYEAEDTKTIINDLIDNFSLIEEEMPEQALMAYRELLIQEKLSALLSNSIKDRKEVMELMQILFNFTKALSQNTCTIRIIQQ